MQSKKTVLRLLSVGQVRFPGDPLSTGILKVHADIVSLLYSIIALPLNRIHAAPLECFPPRHAVRIQERGLAEPIIVESGSMKHTTIIPYCCVSQHFGLTVKNQMDGSLNQCRSRSSHCPPSLLYPLSLPTSSASPSH